MVRLSGKTHLRDFILPHIEDSSRIYVEGFCGSANIFFAKRPHDVEVLNDLNGDIVNFFRVLQHRRLFGQFARRIRWTPYAVEEFDAALQVLAKPPAHVGPDIERAWAFFVRGSLGFSGAGESRGNWRRSFMSSGGGMAQVTSNWRTRTALLEAWRDRLLHAQIDNKNALELIEYWDSPETVFYLDPPYVEDTRVSLNVYSHEMNDYDHVRLTDVMLKVQGRIVLSGYKTSHYHRLEQAGWIRLDKEILSPATRIFDEPHGTRVRGNNSQRAKRTECLWINRVGAEGNLWQNQVVIEPFQPLPPVEKPDVLPPPVERWTDAKEAHQGTFEW